MQVTPTDHPQARSQDSLIAVAGVLGLLAVCVGLGVALNLWLQRPSPLDTLFPTAPGTAVLYRVTFADGSQGFATRNGMQLSTDARADALTLGLTGRQVRLTLTGDQSPGPIGQRVDRYLVDGDALTLRAVADGDRLTTFDPPLPVWSPALMQHDRTQPLTAVATTRDGQTISQSQWRDGRDTLTLANGSAVAAERYVTQLSVDGQLQAETILWLASPGGVVRQEERDGSGRLRLRLDWLADSQPGLPATMLPLDALLTTAVDGVFRQDAARSGAVSLPAAPTALVPAWQMQTAAAYTASPTVAGELLYAADQTGRVVAVDPAADAVRWAFTVGGPVVAAPAIADGIVYIGAGDKSVTALEAAAGHFLWRVTFDDNVATSPAVAQGLLFVGVEDRHLVALDALTGAERWRFRAGRRIISSPAYGGGRLFVGADDATVYALDAASGNLIWQTTLNHAVAAPTALFEGVVYAVTIDGQAAALDAADGALIWSRDFEESFIAAPAVDAERVLVAGVDDTVYALDRATGSTRWQWRTPDDASFVSSPLLLGETAVLVESRGAIYLLAAATGSELQRIEHDAGFSASPAYGHGTLYLADLSGRLLGLRASP